MRDAEARPDQVVWLAGASAATGESASIQRLCRVVLRVGHPQGEADATTTGIPEAHEAQGRHDRELIVSYDR